MNDRLTIFALSVILFASALAFVTIGATNWNSLIIELRLVKIWGLIIVGLSVGIATVILQTLAMNRILTPGIMGFDALFVFIQSVLIALVGGIAFSSIAPGLKFSGEVVAMASLSAMLFAAVLARGSSDVTRLLLIAVVIGMLLRSLSAFVQRLLDPSEFAILQGEMFASFGTIDETNLAYSTFALLIALPVIAWLSPQLDVMLLGRAKASSLGVNHRRLLLIGLATVSVLSAVSTALVGPITFLGLLIASLARVMVASYHHAILLPVSGLLGAVALVCGQLAFERLFAAQTALAFVIEALGGLLFLALVFRRRTA